VKQGEAVCLNEQTIIQLLVIYSKFLNGSSPAIIKRPKRFGHEPHRKKPLPRPGKDKAKIASNCSAFFSPLALIFFLSFYFTHHRRYQGE
jgi:hypothetical protein